MFLILKRKQSEANNSKMLRFEKTPDDEKKHRVMGMLVLFLKVNAQGLIIHSISLLPDYLEFDPTKFYLRRNLGCFPRLSDKH